MDKVITISKNKENMLEFSVEIQGLDDTSNVDVRFIIVTTEFDLSFKCSKIDDDNWSVKIPSISFINTSTYSFHISVVANGYFFDALQGSINVTESNTEEHTKPDSVSATQPQVAKNDEHKSDHKIKFSSLEDILKKYETKNDNDKKDTDSNETDEKNDDNKEKINDADPKKSEDEKETVSDTESKQSEDEKEKASDADSKKSEEEMKKIFDEAIKHVDAYQPQFLTQEKPQLDVHIPIEAMIESLNAKLKKPKQNKNEVTEQQESSNTITIKKVTTEGIIEKTIPQVDETKNKAVQDILKTSSQKIAEPSSTKFKRKDIIQK